MANSTQGRATLAELSHVEGNKKGVDVHSCFDAKVTDFGRTFY